VATGAGNRNQLCSGSGVGELIKGIILADGRGTRLDPLTQVTNKHLLPVGKEPMIWHSVKQLLGSGITEILVITSTQLMQDIVKLPRLWQTIWLRVHLPGA